MTDSRWHVAQLNVGRLIAPEGDPRVAGFYADLDRINALADSAPGFVWRLVDDDGRDATALRPFDDDTLVNLSVWTTIEALYAFTYRSAHLDVLRRRREWFHPLGDAYAVLWWIPAGTLPTVDEAGARLALLRARGATAEAFTLRERFPCRCQPITRWSGRDDDGTLRTDDGSSWQGRAGEGGTTAAASRKPAGGAVQLRGPES